MKKYLLLLIASLFIFAGCTDSKTLYYYSIPGEGMPVLEAVDNCSVDSYSEITQRNSSKKIDIKAGSSVDPKNSCIVIEEKGKAILKNDINDTAWLYRIKKNVIEGHKEIQVSFKKGDHVDLLAFQAEGYFIIKKGRKIIDLHVSELEIKQKPVTKWYVKDPKIGSWVEVDSKCVDVIKREM